MNDNNRIQVEIYSFSIKAYSINFPFLTNLSDGLRYRFRDLIFKIKSIHK